MPAQPPFLTPTRTPMISLAAFAITYLMRSAAASVSRITWGLGRGLAILSMSFLPVILPCPRGVCVGSYRRHRNQVSVFLPHVEHRACFDRHPALLPGRVPHDIDLDGAH